MVAGYSTVQTRGEMSLLEPPPVRTDKSRVWPFTIVALLAILALVLWFTFRYYPEKRAVGQFFDALVAGDTDKAYALWKPTPSYKKDDFLADWGPAGYYGPVRSYKILGARAPSKSDSIAVRIAVSRFSPLPAASDGEKSQKTKFVTLWVSAEDKSFSFPP
jgi:hypothetical protein